MIGINSCKWSNKLTKWQLKLCMVWKPTWRQAEYTIWNVETTPALFRASTTPKRNCTHCRTKKFTISFNYGLFCLKHPDNTPYFQSQHYSKMKFYTWLYPEVHYKFQLWYILFETSRPHQLFSEPTLLKKEILHLVVPRSSLVLVSYFLKLISHTLDFSLQGRKLADITSYRCLFLNKSLDWILAVLKCLLSNSSKSENSLQNVKTTFTYFLCIQFSGARWWS